MNCAFWFNIVGAFLNDTIQPVTFNYNNPAVPFVINGRFDPTSQRFHVSGIYENHKKAFQTCLSRILVLRSLLYQSLRPLHSRSSTWSNFYLALTSSYVRTPSFVTPSVRLQLVRSKTPTSRSASTEIRHLVSNGNCASTCAMFSTLMFERHQTKIAIFGGKPGEQVQYKGMAGNQVLEWSDLDTEIKSVGLDNVSNFRLWRLGRIIANLLDFLRLRTLLPPRTCKLLQFPKFFMLTVPWWSRLVNSNFRCGMSLANTARVLLTLTPCSHNWRTGG